MNTRLLTWQEIKHKYKWGTLLIGNGASRAISNKFNYPSLFEIACLSASQKGIAKPLTKTSQNLFESMGTTNFEAILAALLVAQTVNKARWGNKLDWIKHDYNEIRNALISSVNACHVKWEEDLVDRYLIPISKELKYYENVYSTNYDLLIYWSIMQDIKCFKDYFFGETFNITNTDVWENVTKLLYLHGGIHLVHNPLSGKTRKKSNGIRNLLSSFGQDKEFETPLFISEGRADEKINAIGRSDYLSFAFHKFSHNTRPLVIFGHGLGESDEHLIKAIHHMPIASPHKEIGGDVAISVWTEGEIDEKDIEATKAILEKKLKREVPIDFFDASTHPLRFSQSRALTPYLLKS